jgi:hypothetical protein
VNVAKTEIATCHYVWCFADDLILTGYMQQPEAEAPVTTVALVVATLFSWARLGVAGWAALVVTQRDRVFENRYPPSRRRHGATASTTRPRHTSGRSA